MPGAQVTAWDISETALAIARGNAQSLGAEVAFEQRDILASVDVNVNPSSRQRRRQRQLDLIVSNPPYITLQEQETMHRNVTDYEPGQALFVADEDPLLFYRAISDFATRALRTGGALYFEINPLYANELQDMLKAKGFGHIQLREDTFGKTRFMRGEKNEKK
jgi:release factor glutamine methyltransferase